MPRVEACSHPIPKDTWREFSVTREEVLLHSLHQQEELLGCAFVPLLSREFEWPGEERSEVQADADSSSSACKLVSESGFSTPSTLRLLLFKV